MKKLILVLILLVFCGSFALAAAATKPIRITALGTGEIATDASTCEVSNSNVTNNSFIFLTIDNVTESVPGLKVYSKTNESFIVGTLDNSKPVTAKIPFNYLIIN